MRFKRLDAQIRAIKKCRKGKWAKLVEGTPKKEPKCNLCDVVNGNCTSCIIALLSGSGCEGTPQAQWASAADVDCAKCSNSDEEGRCEGERCDIDASRPRAKKQAKRESRFLGAIQKGLEVMQRELRKIK